MRLLATFLTCSFLLLSTQARADDKSHRKAILEFFELADMEKMLEATMDATLTAQVQAQPAIAPFRPTLEQFFAKYMSWSSLREDFLAMYMKTFTEAEVRQILAFYKTPVGKKTLDQMPKLMQDGAQLGAKRVQDHMPELMQMLQAAAEKQQPKKSPTLK